MKQIAGKGISQSRLKTLYERQGAPAFGPYYQPGIRAVREEAPSISKAFTLYDQKVGRHLQLLSSFELLAALVALYIPSLVDLHEQKLLQTKAGQHPLYGFPGEVNISLPNVAGTLTVAHQLGYLKLHPLVSVTDPGVTEKLRVAFPYVGDLLLFLQDEAGVYCVNWTIKKDADAFRGPGPNPSKRKLADPDRATQEAMARHEIEAKYYADVGIRTVQFAGDQVNKNVVDNLRFLHKHHFPPAKESAKAYTDMVRAYKAGMSTQIAPIVTMRSLMIHYGWPFHECASVLYRAIWRRDLRVDLYTPILPDRPLKPESSDFLASITHWYSR